MQRPGGSRTQVFYQQQEHQGGHVEAWGEGRLGRQRSAVRGVVTLPNADFVRNAGMF